MFFLRLRILCNDSLTIRTHNNQINFSLQMNFQKESGSTFQLGSCFWSISSCLFSSWFTFELLTRNKGISILRQENETKRLKGNIEPKSRGGTSWGSARVLAQAGWAEPARLSSAHYFELAGQLGSAQLTILKLKFQLGSAQLANLAKNLKILKFLLNKKFSSLSSARNFDHFCQLGCLGSGHQIINLVWLSDLLSQ